MKPPSSFRLVLLGLLAFPGTPLHAQIGVQKEILGVGAIAQSSPPQITLSWQPNANTNTVAAAHSVFRRNPATDRNALFSTDGLAWTPATGAPARGLAGVAHGLPSGVSTFVGISEDAALYRSTDGSTWTRTGVVDDTDDKPRTIAYGNGRYITSIGGYFFSSTNAVDWTKSTRYATLANYPVVIHDLTFANGTWVAVGRGYGGGSILNAEAEDTGMRMGIMTSTDGSTWILRKENDTTSAPGNPNIGRTLQGVAFGNGAWVAVGLGGNIYRSTDNGVTWTSISNSITSGTSTATHLYGVAYNAGAFVAVGTSANSTTGTPVLLRSTDDGLTWSAVSLGGNPATRQTLNRIRTAGGQLHALGDGGAYIVSTDGLTWTARSTTNTSPLRDIAFGTILQVIASQPGWGKTPIISGLSGTTLTYTDAMAQAGILYDYAVHRLTVSGGQYGSIDQDPFAAAIALPVRESLGTVVLVVENTLPTTLASDYATFRQDLLGDGWKIEEILVPRALTNPTASERLAEVQSIRTAIQALYQANPTQVNTVLLLGRVPVPISGNIGPDGHASRPFPADTYYGDMTGTWTDTRSDTGYTPGDGKLDPFLPPVLAELAVGRVDFGNMPAFALTETQLIQRYLQKNHRFRHGLTTANKKSYAANNWGSNGSTINITDYVAIPLLRGYAASLGFSNLTYSQTGGWKTALNASSYLLSYGSGAGSNTSASGIVTTDEFAVGNYPTFFMTLYGSYFCEYNLSNNLLRAAIGMPDYGLTAQWSAHTPVYYGLNIPVGLSRVKAYATPSDSPFIPDLFSIYDVIIGDPTLRILPAKPVGNLTLTASGGQITLNWSAPTDTNIVGYHVYRADSASGPFTRLTGAAITASNPTGSASTGTSFTDSTIAPATVYHYQVRAVKLESGNEGTHYHMSQGVFATNEIPVVAPNQSVSAPTDTALSYRIAASNGPTSYALASGSLPPGLTLNAATGVISGTPTTVGVYTPTFTATNGGGTSSAVTISFAIISSALILQEPFNYTVGSNSPDPDGGLNNNNGLPATNLGGVPSGTSTGFYGNYGATLDVVAGLTYAQGNRSLVTSGGAAAPNNAAFGAGVTVYRNMTTDPHLARRVGGAANGNFGVDGDTLYLSFLARSSSTTNRAFWLCFTSGSRNIYIGNTATTWAIEDNAAGLGSSTGAFTVNSTALIVVRLTFAAGAADTMSLWVNPPLGGTLPSTPNATLTIGADWTLNQMNFRPQVLGAMTMDEFRMGTSYAAVTPYVEVPPVITAAQATTGSVNSAFAYDLQASGSPTSYALASGALPPGVTFNVTTGRLSGTPTATGTYTPGFTATNAAGTSAAVAVTITIGNAPTQLIGSVIGTAGSYNNGTATVDKAFDGNLSTFFDAPTANGNWAGLDFGAGNERFITEVRYAPRGGGAFPDRLINAVIQGSSSADFSSGVVNLYTIPSAPTAGVLTTQAISNSTPFRYVRILMPNGSYGNVAELQFYGLPPLPAAPSNLAATASSTTQINLTWTDNSTNETGFKLERSPDGSTGWTQIAALVANATAESDSGLSVGTIYFYRLRAANAAGESSYTAIASATTFTGVQSFRSTNGLASNGTQDLLTPAGDGVPNILKYAFNMIGGGAGQGSTLAMPNAAILSAVGNAGLPRQGVDGAGKLQITYVRRKAALNPGVTYTVEFSDAFANWATNPSASEVVTSLDPTFERVTLTDSLAAPAKRFARVKITAQ